MKKIISILCLVILSLQYAVADRVIPQDMQHAVIKNVQFPYIKLGSDHVKIKRILSLGLLERAQQFTMNNSVRVRDEHNRFIVYGQLSQHINRPVVVRFDNQKRINEIWILTPSEHQQYH